MMSRNRVIDIAKGLGMAIVVLYHAEILSGIWTQFHMPLFAFLSGMLYSQKSNSSIKSLQKYTLRKLRGIYVPFVEYNLDFLCLHNVFVKTNILSPVHNGFPYEAKDFIRQIFLIFSLGGVCLAQCGI